MSATAKALVAVVLIGIALAIAWPYGKSQGAKGRRVARTQHVYDRAGLLNDYDRGKFEEYLRWIFTESDIDIRFVFVRGTGNQTIEELAVDTVEALKIGGRSREERGLLLLYDLEGKKLRIEVGYGLEYYFPDGFVSYLTHGHAEAFFASGDLTMGLKLLLRLLHHRIREAVLGNEYDPTFTEMLYRHRYLSGGAGVSQTLPIGDGHQGYLSASLSETERQSFLPQTTPEATYERYLAWLACGRPDAQVELFTPESKRHIASFPMTRAYFDYLLMQEYGRAYRVDVRGDLALLYFTDDPLVCPHFLVKRERGWQMDIAAEVRNTTNRVGGVYIWDYRGQDDSYTRAFGDQLVKIDGYVRLAGGDNRKLPVRAGAGK